MNMIVKDVVAVNASLKAQAERESKTAIGKSLTIRLAGANRPKASAVSTVTGIIVECAFGYFKDVGINRTVVFKVVMECGPNKTRREAFITRLPA